jgi:hypothetical protein
VRWKGLAGLALVTGTAWGAWWWINLPRTPQEFFMVRCSTCHKLPDLAKYKQEDMAGIVRTMRTKHGAEKVIDEGEAEIITRFLEESKQ